MVSAGFAAPYSLPLEGGGFGGLRRSRKEFRFDKILLPQSASLTAPPEEEPTLKTNFF